MSCVFWINAYGGSLWRDKCEGAGERVALKVATPAAAWEFAAARVITDRVPARYASLFLPARCIFLSSGWDTPSAAETGVHSQLLLLAFCQVLLCARTGSEHKRHRHVAAIPIPKRCVAQILDASRPVTV